MLVAGPLESSAAQKINKPLGQEAFRRIRDARQVLDRVDAPLRGRDFDKVQVRKLLAKVATGTAKFAPQRSKDIQLLVPFEVPSVAGACIAHCVSGEGPEYVPAILTSERYMGWVQVDASRPCMVIVDDLLLWLTTLRATLDSFVGTAALEFRGVLS